MCKPCKGWGSLWTVLTKIYYYGDGSEQAREEQDVLVSEKCIVVKMAGCGLIHHPSWVSNDCFIVQ